MTTTTIRSYLRRSKNDDGKQQFSLDVQRAGCREFLARIDLADRPVVEYVDDGRAGDDFLTRAGLRQLLAEAKAGDVVICRDQSRLGRDAIEVTLVVRDLVRDRGCRLFYYVNGQEVAFANAIDAATTFIQGTGHQMELEAIRSRVREALRSRVLSGRVAGGVCYGYRLERQADSTGRKYSIAIVVEQQAAIVRRIFNEYAAGRGLKLIAHDLNRDGVAPPEAGKRGTGSWAPGCIRAMLRNPRYRGVYVHGKVKKVRTSGVVARVKADPSEIIAVEVPDWRIVDDETWLAVEARFSTRATPRPMMRSAAKYPLTGIARCATCGGAIACASTRVNGVFVKMYGCRTNRQRGPRACPVSVRQDMAVVENALLTYLREKLLTGEMLTRVLNEYRRTADAMLRGRPEDLAEIEAELRDVRAEQKQLAKAVAISDDIPELVSQMKRGAQRIAHLEGQIVASRRAPAELAALMRKMEKDAYERLEKMQATLADPAQLRQVFLAAFPEGLQMRPRHDGTRAGWEINGLAEFPLLSERDSCLLDRDPKGT